MNFIYDLIPERFINAIGWTIFHSVWQGIVISIFLGSSLLMTKRNNSKLRYRLSAAALFVMFGISFLTFIYFYSNAKPAEISASGSVVETFSYADSSADASPLLTSPALDLSGALKNYFDRNMPLIVTMWLAGFILFSFRFAGGLIYVERLKTSGLKSPEDFWKRRVKELSGKFNLDKIINLYESCRVKTPVTIGYLKPVILIPLGMLSGLPQEQVEAILIHELAHIKRYDFLVNLFQTFIETIFFYHPVVWWISSTIKSERENRCDDLTLQNCGGSLVYFKALYNLQQLTLDENGLALAVTGKKNQLFRRINRMNSTNKNTSYGIKFAAFASLLFLIAAASLYSTSSAKENARELSSPVFINPVSQISDLCNTAADTDQSAADTTSIKKGKRTLKFSDENKKYKAKLEEGKLKDFYIDGEKVDAKDLPKYEGLVNDRMNEFDSSMEEYRAGMKEYKDKMKQLKEKIKKFRGTAGVGRSYDFDFDFDVPVPPIALNLPDIDTTNWKKMVKDIQHSIQSGLANHSFHIPHMDFSELHKTLNDSLFNKEEFKKAMKELQFNLQKEMGKLKSNDGEFKKEMEKFKEEMKKSGPGSEAFKKSMEELKVSMANLKVEMKKLKDFVHAAKDEMVKDKLIEEGDDLDDFTLSNSEMIVAGKKVSPELHKKYLELYKKSFGKELKGDEKFRIDN